MIFLAILILIAPIGAYIYMSKVYAKYNKVLTKTNMTGQEVASTLLKMNALEEVYVIEVKGILNDHYDYHRKVIKLSSKTFHGTSLTSMGIAARLVIHAVWHRDKKETSLKREAVEPLFDLLNIYALPFSLICMIFSLNYLFLLGIVGVFIVLGYNMISLIDEFNCVKEASIELTKIENFDQEENKNLEELMDTTAMTYIASTVISFINLYYTISDKLDKSK